MPLEKRFAMLRKEAAALDKDIDRAKNELAREIVEVRELTRQTDELKAQVEKAAKELVARGDTINDATNNKVSVGRQTISVAEAKSRLQKDVSSHVKVVKRLEVMEKTLAQREQIRDTLQKTLDSLKAKKSEALIAIDELEAEYKELQLTQIESKYQADESRLAKIKETLAKIRKDIEVKKEVLQLTPSVREDAPAEGTATGSQSVEDILAPVKAQR
jgi:chromosome segregation ATPase